MILLTPDTKNYRQLAASHVRSSDKVLEIGCSTGECTVLLLRHLILLQHQHFLNQQKSCVMQRSSSFHGQIVAFDTGYDMIEQARNRLLSEFDRLLPDDICQKSTDRLFPDMVQFHKVNALANPKGAQSHAVDGNNRTPDVVLIDIGGNRELKGVIRMIEWVQSAFQCSPRLIIIKSEALAEELTIPHGSNDNGRDGESDRDQSVHNGGSACTSVMPSVMESGIILNAQEWFESLLLSSADDAKCKPAKNAKIS
eukprot:CAMPEP_0181126790 /NCGR_PEP_ID=MMETSP1071-20121207/27831_1 /TAXON_ID=35127 /ORGANISM="Thalassiosira sp., Strain NH16" /LENGTH=253 /DNA_ID=CAMNT_0023212443 /DNA_START=453 /DNA_END=1211 /DNA_ORIENTATION=+